jgi:enterochelin esterase family protein
MPSFATSTEPIARLGLHSSAEINRVLRERRFPHEEDGWFAFLYHDPEQRLESVRLHHGLAGYRQPPVMERLPGGVHVLALHAPSISRVEYELELIEEDTGGRHLTIDPLARIPRPEARGRLEPVALPVSVDAPDRALSGDAMIWHPPGADATEPLPVLIVLDGPEYARFACLDRLLANLVDAGEIAPCRAVLLPPTHRNRQYSADPATALCLAELLPDALAEHLPWPKRSADRIGLGASLGGLALLHAHAAQPALFGGLILQSGSYFQPSTDGMEHAFRWFGRIAHFVSGVLDGTVDLARVPIHLTCGLGGENLPNNRAMVDALRERGIAAQLTLVGDAHNWIAWRNCVIPGLKDLLGGKS